MKLNPGRNFRLFYALQFALVLLATGCFAPTEVDRDNRRLLDAILTAITMKNANWLEDDAKLAEQRHTARQLSEGDYKQLLLMIEQGRSGNWQAAEQMGYEFRKAHPFVKAGQ